MPPELSTAVIGELDLSLAAYEELRAHAVEAVDAGRLAIARDALEQAHRLAVESGDATTEKRAFLNLASLDISLGRGEEVLGRLRALLLASSDPVSGRLAAYNVARICEFQKRYKRGLFYARLALAKALEMREARADWIASGHNQIGNFLAAESRFAEAAEEYRRALELDTGASEVRRALVTNNLGFCRFMLGDRSVGLEMLERALEVYRRGDLTLQRMIVHLDLCYAHLELGEPERAERHGREALALGESLGHPDTVKNALYLLGEASLELDRPAEAATCFERLRRLFPETPVPSATLLAVGLRSLINLRA